MSNAATRWWHCKYVQCFFVLTSATFVDTTILRFVVERKTAFCSAEERVAWRGNISVVVPMRGADLNDSMHCLISWTPGMKIRIAPGPLLATMCVTTDATS